MNKLFIEQQGKENFKLIILRVCRKVRIEKNCENKIYNSLGTCKEICLANNKK